MINQVVLVGRLTKDIDLATPQVVLQLEALLLL